MDNEFDTDLVVLVDEDGEQHTFEILDVIEHEDKNYYALLPVFDSPEEQVESDGQYYIFGVVEEDGEELLEEVDDDDLLDELDEIFTERFDSLFDDDEDEDE